MKNSDYKKLQIWEKSMELSVDLYNLTKKFPDEEKFGLISQIRRAAVSIPSNIAEGHGRFHNKDFAHFIRTSVGSASEIETQLILSNRLGFIDENTCEKMCGKVNEVIKMMIGFINSLNNK